MSKLMKRNIAPQKKEEVVVEQPVTTVVPIRMLHPNILIAQGGVIGVPTINNAMGVFAGDMEDGKYGTYHMMSEAARQKLCFLITDALLSCLNTCVKAGFIELSMVDVNDFTYNYHSYEANTFNIEANIGMVAARICQDCFNNLYKYAVLGRHSDPESAKDLVNFINSVVANISNLVLYHLSGYYNEEKAINSMVNHDPDILNKIGAYDQAYNTENVFGEMFLSKENVERTNRVIATDIEYNAEEEDDVVIEYTFDPAKRPKHYRRDEDDFE